MRLPSDIATLSPLPLASSRRFEDLSTPNDPTYPVFAVIRFGRVWQNEPRAEPQPGCRYFAETGHNLCEPFLSYWRAHGLEFDRHNGTSEAESLALFGYPITEAAAEVGADGVARPTQWFQRARFEDHGPQGVLLGLLGNEVYGQ